MICSSSMSLRTMKRFNLNRTNLQNIKSNAIRSISSTSTSTSHLASPNPSLSKSRCSPLTTTRSLSTNQSLKSISQSLVRSQTSPPPIQSSSAVSAAQRAYSSITNDPSTIPTSSFVETTTLPNGVRVATETTPGHFSAVGVYIDAGSRFERPWVPGESGVSHMLDRLAFKVSGNRTRQSNNGIDDRNHGAREREAYIHFEGFPSEI